MGSLNHFCIFGYILKIVFLDFLLFPLGNLKFLSAEQHKPFFIIMLYELEINNVSLVDPLKPLIQTPLNLFQRQSNDQMPSHKKHRYFIAQSFDPSNLPEEYESALLLSFQHNPFIVVRCV